MGIENSNNLTTQPSYETGQELTQEDTTGRQRRIIIVLAIVGVLLLAGLIAGLFFLLQPTTDTARVRDIFIIIMALESLLLGLVLIILVLQLARLINLLQNEIKPILESTNETVSTLRGTTAFLSDNLVEPVIRLNEYLAAVNQVRSFFGLTRRRDKS